MIFTNVKCDQSQVRNLSVAACVKKFGWFKGMFLVPKNWSLTATQIASLQTNLTNALINNSADSRIYMLGKFHTVETSYTDRNTVTRGDGTTRTTRNAIAGWTLGFDNGGMCYSRSVLSFRDRDDQFDVVFINDGGSLIGSRKFNTTTNQFEFKGIPMSMFDVPIPLVGTPDEVDRYSVQAMLQNSDDMFVNGWIIDTTFSSLDELPTIQDVALMQLSSLSSGVVQIAAGVGCGAINLASGSLAASFANVARWSATNYATGAAITISSVAVNASATGFTFTLDTGDTDYPTSGGYIAIKLVSVSTLATAGLRYYESFAENPGQSAPGTAVLIPVP